MAPGAAFEKQFAEYMEEWLGYAETERRIPVTGKVSNRHYEVDVHGVRYSAFMSNLRWAGLLLVFLAVAAYLLPEYLGFVQSATESAARSIAPELAGSSLAILGIGAFFLGLWAKARTEEHAWVECKSHKTRVKRAAIQKLVSSADDVRASEDMDWYPDLLIFAALNGYDPDALNVAREHDVMCFEWDAEEEDFVEVE